MGQSFKEKSFLKTDKKKYSDNYDKIFNKKKYEAEKEFLAVLIGFVIICILIFLSSFAPINF